MSRVWSSYSGGASGTTMRLMSVDRHQPNRTRSSGVFALDARLVGQAGDLGRFRGERDKVVAAESAEVGVPEGVGQRRDLPAHPPSRKRWMLCDSACGS